MSRWAGTRAAALLLALGAAVAEVGTFFLWFLTSAETGHAAGALIVLTGPALCRAFVITATAAFCLFRDGSAGGGGAAWSIAFLEGFVVEAVVAPAKSTAHRLRFIEAVVSVIQAAC